MFLSLLLRLPATLGIPWLSATFSNLAPSSHGLLCIFPLLLSYTARLIRNLEPTLIQDDLISRSSPYHICKDPYYK